MAKTPGKLSETQVAVLAKATTTREAIQAATRRGDSETALRGYQDLRRAGQLSAEEWMRLGDLLDARGVLTEAVTAYKTAVSMNRALTEARQKLAYGLVRMNRVQDALAEYAKGVQIDGTSANLWTDYGVTLAAQQKEAAAGEAFNRALAINPNLMLALVGRANVRAAQGRHDEAHPDFERAFKLQPDNPLPRFNYAGSCLRRGDWAEGFKHYEARWGVNNIVEPIHRIPGAWLGEGDIAGKSIWVEGEQGFGDMLMFCRFLPNLADLGAKVIVNVPRALQDVIQSVDPRLEVLAMEDNRPVRADRYIPMASLALAFKAMPDKMPMAPYLKPVDAPDRLVAPPRTERRRIGIVWSGGTPFGLSGVRAVPLQDLLKAVSGAGEIIALQKEATKAERALLAKHDVAFFGDDLKNFADTAALAVSCDLVVSCDTGVAHLVAGLGVPLWLLLPFFSGWWAASGDQSPWYQEVRLWRQLTSEDWPGILAKVKDALAA